MEIVKGKVFVVGAGIGGLATAFWLGKAGFEVIVYEKSEVAGGRMRTIEVEGCRFDVGASLMPSAFTHTQALAREAGLEHLIEPTIGKIAFMRDDQPHFLDMQKLVASLLGTKVIGKGSKIKLGKLMLKAYRNKSRLSFDNYGLAAPLDTESAADYCQRELSEESLRYFLGPFMRAMYLHSPEDASVAELLWCMNNLLGTTFNFHSGIDALPKKLAEQLDVRFSSEVLSIQEHTGSVVLEVKTADGQVHSEIADYCVVATDAKILQSLCGHLLSDKQNSYISNLNYANDAVVSLVLDKVPQHDAVLTMPAANRDEPLCVAVQEHKKCSGRVPANMAVVTCHLIREWNAEFFDKDESLLIEQCKRSLNAFMPEVNDHIIATHVERWSNTAVDYPVGGCADLAGFMADINSKSRVQYCGEYMSQSTINTPVATAQKVVLSIKTKLEH